MEKLKKVLQNLQNDGKIKMVGHLKFKVIKNGNIIFLKYSSNPCEECGKKSKFEIVSYIKGCGNNLINGIPMCIDCLIYSLEHFKECGWELDF